MLSEGIARRMAEAMGARLTAPPTALLEPREGAFFLDLEAGDNMRFGQTILDAACLSEEEKAILCDWEKPIPAWEGIDAETGQRLFLYSPYEATPRLPSKPNKNLVIEVREIFHFHEPWRWTIPVVLLDLYPERPNRDRILEIFCKHHAKNNHERVRIRGLHADKA